MHAFPAEGGFVRTSSMISVLSLNGHEGHVEEFFGPYDAFVSECGHVVPVAMLLPSSAEGQCTSCLMLTGTVPSDVPRRGFASFQPLPRRQLDQPLIASGH